MLPLIYFPLGWRVSSTHLNTVMNILCAKLNPIICEIQNENISFKNYHV